MSKTVTTKEVEREIRAHPDELLGNIFEPGSFQKEAYMNASEAHLAHTGPDDADRRECEKYGLTPEQWSEQMTAVALARHHDATLDLLEEGGGRV